MTTKIIDPLITPPPEASTTEKKHSIPEKPTEYSLMDKKPTNQFSWDTQPWNIP